jgi:hypothetical protein
MYSLGSQLDVLWRELNDGIACSVRKDGASGTCTLNEAADGLIGPCGSPKAPPIFRCYLIKEVVGMWAINEYAPYARKTWNIESPTGHDAGTSTSGGAPWSSSSAELKRSVRGIWTWPHSICSSQISHTI